MPLAMANPGECMEIVRIGGSLEVRRHLEELGFVAGSRLVVISVHGGNVICSVRETRVGISKELAAKIFVTPAAVEENETDTEQARSSAGQNMMPSHALI